MGSVPYISLRQGDGPTFEVSILQSAQSGVNNRGLSTLYWSVQLCNLQCV